MSNETTQETTAAAARETPASRDAAAPRESDVTRVIERTVEQAVEQAIAAYSEKQHTQAEPAETAMQRELTQERKKRESLEKRVNELVEESRRAREAAEQTDRYSAIKSELQQLGVTKVDLAFRAVRDDVHREGDRLLAQTEEGAVPLRDYLTQWVTANPEFKPARIAGGAGTSASRSSAAGSSSFDLDRIRPGMSAEEMERARQEIARVAAHAIGGQIL